MVVGGAELGPAQFDVLVAGADAVAHEPAAETVPTDGDVAGHEFGQGRGGDVDVAEQDELGAVDEAHALGLDVVDADLQALAALADLGVVGLDIDRHGGVDADGQRAGGDVGAAEEVDLVRQADADQGAARALGAVHQGLGDAPAGGDEAQAVDGLAGEALEVVGELDPHPLAAGGEVEDTGLALVAVLGQDHPLDAELHALRVVGPLGDVGAAAALVVHRGDAVTLALDEVELGDEAQAVGGQGDGAGVDLLHLRGLALVLGGLGLGLGVGELAAGLVHPAVDVAALDGVAGVVPLPLDPFQVGESRAIGELVDHAGRQQRHVPGHFREGEFQFLLLGDGFWLHGSLLTGGTAGSAWSPPRPCRAQACPGTWPKGPTYSS